MALPNREIEIGISNTSEDRLKQSRTECSVTRTHGSGEDMSATGRALP